MLVGIVFGAIAAVALRGRGVLFFINVLLSIIGTCIGAFFPVLIGQSFAVDVSDSSYILRGLFGAFLLVSIASLFRSAKPPRVM